MTANELKVYDSLQSQFPNYWAPIHWIFRLIRIARDKGMIESDIIYVDMLEAWTYTFSDLIFQI